MIFHYETGQPQQHAELGQRLKNLTPGSYIVSIKRNRPIKSLGQSKYLFGVVYKTIAMETGMDDEQLHELFKLKFNPQQVTLPNGSMTVLPGSTKDFDTQEMTSFITKVKHFAAEELNIHIPELKDVDYKLWMEINERHDRVFNP
jgi:hypothetical protein